jgi:surface antigen
MISSRTLACITSALVGIGAIAPSLAQPYGPAPGFGRPAENPYDEGYRQGYRAGYDDGRGRRRYDDTDYNYGRGYEYSRRDDSKDERWRQRYSRVYTYNDDNFYRECRQTVDPAGAIAGALIGGILGNVAGSGSGRGGATVAGVILGGALGAALTRNLDCEDRSYAYKTYYDGFNAGRPNARYQWRNPKNGHYGEFVVRDYSNDQDGFRCANYTQQIFIDGRPQAASGRACQQPDGTWAVVG